MGSSNLVKIISKEANASRCVFLLVMLSLSILNSSCAKPAESKYERKKYQGSETKSQGSDFESGESSESKTTSTTTSGGGGADGILSDEGGTTGSTASGGSTTGSSTSGTTGSSSSTTGGGSGQSVGALLNGPDTAWGTLVPPSHSMTASTIESFSSTDGRPGVGVFQFKASKIPSSVLAVAAVSSVQLSKDFKLLSFEGSAPIASGDGTFEQTFKIRVGFRYTPANKVQYDEQRFSFRYRDSSSGLIYASGIKLKLFICSQSFMAQCASAAPDTVVTGENTHPQAIGGW